MNGYLVLWTRFSKMVYYTHKKKKKKKKEMENPYIMLNK